MNGTQKMLIALLKSAITDQALPLPEPYDPEALVKSALQQQVAGLAYDGAVRCGLDPDTPEMKRLFQVYCRQIQQNQRQMTQFSALCRGFEAENIDYLPLKGSRMKALYPRPELRTMGDADILIRTEQLPRIRTAMERLGFAWEEETDHECKWKAPGLQVELHKRLVPSYDTDYYAYYRDGWAFAQQERGSRYLMSDADTFVYLFAHFAKHFRGGGAGCRYVTDLWVYLRTHPALDLARVEGELEKLRLAEFYRNIRKLIACWFADDPWDASIERISAFIFDNGVWGTEASQAQSKSLRASKQAPLGLGGRVTYMLQQMFPSLELMRFQYAILEKAPFLLPVTWVLRGIRCVFLEPERFRRKRRTVQAMEPEATRQFEEFLHSVGLEFP